MSPLRTLGRHAVAVALGFVAIASASPAIAQDRLESTAMEANSRLRVWAGPELLLPSDGGPVGAGMIIDGRYGFRVGPAVIAPGGRVAADIISSRFVTTAMPTARFTVPIGPLAPYLVGGVGLGGLSNDAEVGAALMAGGGLMFHFAPTFALGGQVTYQRITGTEFQVLSIAPMLQLVIVEHS